MELERIVFGVLVSLKGEPDPFNYRMIVVVLYHSRTTIPAVKMLANKVLWQFFRVSVVRCYSTIAKS